MARAAIRFAESALADLESIRDWYAERDVPEVGERLIGEIVASMEALADHPDMGRIVPEFDQPFLRELIRPPGSEPAADSGAAPRVALLSKTPAGNYAGSA